MQRKTLFDQASAALRALGVNGDYCVCPICSTGFDRSALDSKDLTLEHAPPKSSGGRAIILTCKQCNNLSGSKFDHQFKARAEFEAARNAVLPGENGGVAIVTIEAGGTSVNASLTRSHSAGEFDISAKHNDPDSVATFRENLRNLQKGEKLTVKYDSKFIPRLARIAELKSAFLIVSAKFGYTFALNDELQAARAQLLEPQSDHHEHAVIACPAIPVNKILVSEPEGLVFVNLNGRVHALPWISRAYENFDLHRKKGFKLSLSGKLFEFPMSFEAILDLQGLRGRSLRITPPASEP